MFEARRGRHPAASFQLGHVIAVGNQIVFGETYEDDQVVLLLTPKRPTLWLRDYPVPVLPQRRSFIASIDDPDEGE